MSSNGSPGIVPEGLANLETVDYEKLLSSDAAEQLKVLSACENRGIFYLHLPRNENQDLWSRAAKVFAVAKELFDQPLQEKMKFHQSLSGPLETSGYKPLGYYSGINEGKRDGFEQFKVPRTGILELDPTFAFNRPEIVTQNWELFKYFVNISHSINTTILVALSTALGLPEGKRFEKFHGTDTLSSSIFACNKHPKHNATDPDIGHNAHTDIGSVTILFAPEWGLQTLQPGTDKWAYVQPLPEHVVIGIGDALRYMSQSRLHSNLHRVVPMTGTIEQQDRYSFMYFMRPDRNTVFRDSEGNAHTYEERHALKTANFRNNHDAMASYVQTGRKGFLGLWNAPTTNALDTN